MPRSTRKRDRSRSRSRSPTSSKHSRRRRSKSKERRRSRSKDRHEHHRHRDMDRHRSRSRDRKRSKSRDRKRSKSRDHKRSRSRDRKRSRSRDRKESKSRSKSRDRKRSRSRDRKESKSRSKSPDSKSPPRQKDIENIQEKPQEAPKETLQEQTKSEIKTTINPLFGIQSEADKASLNQQISEVQIFVAEVKSRTTGQEQQEVTEKEDFEDIPSEPLAQPDVEVPSFDEVMDSAELKKVEIEMEMRRHRASKGQAKSMAQREKDAELTLAHYNQQIEKEIIAMEEEKLKEKEEKIKKEELPDDYIDPLDAFMDNLEGATNQVAIGDMSSHEPTQAELTNKGSRRELIDTQETEELQFIKNVEDAQNANPDDIPSWLRANQAKGKKILKVDHDAMQYDDYNKNFYIQHPDITSMSNHEVEDYRAKVLEGVVIRGKNCPRPIKTWEHCGLPDPIYRVLKKHNYAKPFPIQAQAMPVIMSGRDVIACAKTGSGKTIAFLLPMLRHIKDQDPLQNGDGPIGLILTPTRELATQIHAETRKFARTLGLRNVCTYGGANIAEQIGQLKRGAEIVVATPGRMIDMLSNNNGRVTNLKRVTYLVLDEADRMFDLGFEPQIMAIIENTRPTRQTLMFSATFPKMIEMLAKKALTEPLEIIIGGRSVAASNIVQNVEVIKESDKFRRLLEILSAWYDKGNILIFVDRQDAVDSLFRDIGSAGYPSLTLHGGMDQTDRDYAITDFKNKLRTVLVATSIAARGLDVKDLNLVINFNVPNHYEDYVHRVGRTGRAGNEGTAITFITPEEDRYAPELVKGLIQSKQAVPQELKLLADDFDTKKTAGLVDQHALNGYLGSGFRFDAAEENQVKEKKRLQGLDFGLETAGDVPNLAEEDKSDKSKNEEKAKPSGINLQLAAAKATASAALKAFEKGGDENAAGEAVKRIMSDLKAKERVDKIQQGLKSVQVKAKELSQKAESLGGDPDLFSEELEINDYPRAARFKVTHKQHLSHVVDWFDVAITTKGNFIPPGRKAPPGERKIYLVIEGKDLNDVRSAKAELLKVLEDASLTCQPDTGIYSKYNVLLITDGK